MTVTQYSLSDVLPFNHLDDSSFSLALYELQNGPVHFDPDRFSSLRYNPIFSNSNASLTQSGSLDPDINFNAVETPCDYFIEIDLTKCSDAKIILMPISLSYILIFVVFLII